MSTSDNASSKPSNNTAAPAKSATLPTDSPVDLPLDPQTKNWIHRLIEGMKVLATNEAERRKIKLF
jgi:hypothetical protein